MFTNAIVMALALLGGSRRSGWRRASRVISGADLGRELDDPLPLYQVTGPRETVDVDHLEHRLSHHAVLHTMHRVNGASRDGEIMEGREGKRIEGSFDIFRIQFAAL